MARIPYPDPGSLTPDNREFLANLPPLNISRLLAASPPLFKPMTRLFNSYLNEGVLDPELREIVILRVAHLLDSDYERVNHQRAARVVGLSPARIEALAPGQDLSVFSEQEQRVIRFVDEVIREGKPSPTVFDAVRIFLDDAQLIELSVIIGVYTMVAQICATFEIDLEEHVVSSSAIRDIGNAVRNL